MNKTTKTYLCAQGTLTCPYSRQTVVTSAAPPPAPQVLLACRCPCTPLASLPSHMRTNPARPPCLLAYCPAYGLPRSAPPHVQVQSTTLPRVATHLRLAWPLACKPCASCLAVLFRSTRAICALLLPPCSSHPSSAPRSA